MATNDRVTFERKVAASVIAVVTFVWAASFIVDIIPSIPYEPSPFIHIAMMGVIGSVLGIGVIRGKGNGNSDKKAGDE